MTEKYDQAFLGILQDQGKIASFMDAVFSFLYRRTDFYILMDPEDKNAKMGFPKGMAESMVYENFKKYQLLAEEKQKMTESRGKATGKKGEPVPAKKVKPEQPKPQSAKTKQEQPKPQSAKTKPEATRAKPEATKTNQEESTTKPEELKPKPGSNTDDDVVISGNVATSDRPYQADAECYNGAVRDTYSWSQTITDLDVRIFVPENILKGKDVQVDIQRKRLKVRVKNAADNNSWETLLDGELTWEVNKEESMWTLHPKQYIHVNMEKIQERWWEAVLEGEDRINVRKIDASRPITDLGDEEQAKIEEMMYNENQKRLGKPQSHEKKVHDILKQAWDKEGSPFQGQPFDPSVLDVAQNNQFTQ